MDDLKTRNELDFENYDKDVLSKADLIDCISCQRPLLRNGVDWTCHECEERNIMDICEECCMNKQLC